MGWHAATILILAAACGRVGFEPHADAAVVPIGHDEDGDGVGDLADVCPHIPGSQGDMDDDGVGDDCDYEPTNPRQRIELFATMQPGDQPFDTSGVGTFTQRADAFHFEGNTGELHMPYVAGDVRIAVGLDVLAIGGTPQKQLYLGLHGATVDPHDFVEFNEIGTTRQAAITRYDGSGYGPLQAQPLPAPIHTGPLFLQTTQLIGSGITMDGGWPGETYHLEAPTANYTGGELLWFGNNGITMDVRWIIVIATR